MNAIEIKGLTKHYKDFTLDNIDLVLPTGCIMGLIGENGAGKSTTIKLIMDMIRRDSGDIKVLGHDNQSGFEAVKENIGVVLDESYFPEVITAKQVNRIMTYTFKNWDEKVYLAYLDKFSLPLDKAFKDYSRGMKMKLGIAVALSHHAKMLILDEATSGLDPIIRDEILDVFYDFNRDDKHSIFISSHIVSDLEKLCDYIAFIHKGKLFFCEEKDRLLEEYATLKCSKEVFESISSDAVKGKRIGEYGVEALVLRDKIPSGIPLNRASIEDIIIYLVREDRK
jgi:ABC-2 type transport system ATP-binding protein